MGHMARQTEQSVCRKLSLILAENRSLCKKRQRCAFSIAQRRLSHNCDGAAAIYCPNVHTRQKTSAPAPPAPPARDPAVLTCTTLGAVSTKKLVTTASKAPSYGPPTPP